MTIQGRMQNFVRNDPGGSLALALVTLAMIMTLVLVATLVSQRMDRQRLYDMEIDSDGYVQVMDILERYPSLSGTANDMATTDRMVTKDEMRDLTMQATAIERDRTLYGMQ